MKAYLGFLVASAILWCTSQSSGMLSTESNKNPGPTVGKYFESERGDNDVTEMK